MVERFFSSLLERPWFVDAAGILILLIPIFILVFFAMKLVGGHLHHFFDFMRQEAKEFARFQPTVGAINFLMLLVLLLFGFVVVAGIEAQKIIGFLASYVGHTKADVFAKSADFTTLFYVLALAASVSVVAVAVDNRRR